MSNKSNPTQSIYTTPTTQFQQELIESLLSEKIPHRELLISGPGLGTVHTIVSLANSLSSMNAKCRIAIVGNGNASLNQQFHQRFSDTPSESKVILAGVRAIRELEDRTDCQDDFWPDQTVAIFNKQALRKKEVIRHLQSTCWDLVYIDQVDYCSSADHSLLNLFLTDENYKRVVFHASSNHFRHPETSSLLANIHKTTWNMEDFLREPGAANNSITEMKIKWIPVTYKRYPIEQEVFEYLKLWNAEIITKESQQYNIRRFLMQRSASSSPMSLEHSVVTLRNSWTNGNQSSQADQITGNDDHSSTGIADWLSTIMGQPDSRLQPSDKQKFLDRLIDLIESLPNDGKLEALEALIHDISSDETKTSLCIFCTFQQTANYLRSSLIDVSSNVLVLTGRNSSQTLTEQIQRYSDGGGILICTDVALKGIELPSTSHFIHYDPPSSELSLHVRLSRYRATHQISHYYLKSVHKGESELWDDINLPDAIPIVESSYASI